MEKDRRNLKMSKGYYGNEIICRHLNVRKEMNEINITKLVKIESMKSSFFMRDLIMREA